MALNHAELIEGGLSRLGKLALPKGGFGYREHGQAFVEPTALALLALSSREASTERPLVRDTLAALSSWQHPDGSFGSFPGDPDPSWATSPALLALIAHRGARTDDAGRWLASWFAPEPPLSAEQAASVKRLMKIDVTIRGWPWQSGEMFATVEPTALGAITLRSWKGEGAAARIAMSLEYLANRECSGGGWNYGNPAFFDSVMKPITLPTAKGLLASVLCGSAKTKPMIERGARALSALLEANPSRKAHAWGALAFAALGDGERAARHAELSVDPGDGYGPFGAGADTTALAVLALRGTIGVAPPCFAPSET